MHLKRKMDETHPNSQQPINHLQHGKNKKGEEKKKKKKKRGSKLSGCSTSVISRGNSRWGQRAGEEEAHKVRGAVHPGRQGACHI
jgi:hypothetical protein